MTEAAAWLRARGSTQWQEPVTGRRRARVESDVSAGHVWLVERSGGDVVATLTVDERADPEFWTDEDDPGAALYVHRMVVTRGDAGRGLGAALLDFASRRAADAGRKWLRLDAWATNRELQDYYRRQGFQHVRTHQYAHRGSGALFQRPAGTELGSGPRLVELRANGRD